MARTVGYKHLNFLMKKFEVETKNGHNRSVAILAQVAISAQTYDASLGHRVP